MRSICRSALYVAALLALGTGCFHHTYQVGTGGDTNGDAKYSKWHSHFLYGIIGDHDVDVRSVCPSGNATVKDEISFINGIVGALIGIIYYPSTVEVYCDGRHTGVLRITPQQLRRIGTDTRTLSYVREALPEKLEELTDALRQYEPSRAGVASADAPRHF